MPGPIYTADILTVSNLSVTFNGISFDYSFNMSNYSNDFKFSAYTFELYNQTTDIVTIIKNNVNFDGLIPSGSSVLNGSVNYIFGDIYTDPFDGEHIMNVSAGDLINLTLSRQILQPEDDPDELNAEPVAVNLQIPAPSSNVVVTNNQIPQQIVDLSSGSSFTFTDPITPSLTQSVKIFSGVGYLPLADLSSNGLTVAIKNSVSTVKYIYAPVDPADLSITDPQKLPMIFKVLDLSGNIQSSVNIPIEVYTDSNLGNVVQYDVSGTIASTSGVLVGPVGNKFKYTITITRGDGDGTHTFSTATPSSGSDPHITTIFGKKYDFHPSTRRNYTLFKSQDMKVSSHFTGLKSGVYYDKVMIDLPNKQQVKVDFHSKQIKGKSSFVSLSEEALPIQYKNHTSDKSVGKIFEPKKMTKLSVAGNNPVDLFVDFQTRYVHFRFPNTLPVPSEMSGLIVEPATRLD
jgi:hypothetical protein